MTRYDVTSDPRTFDEIAEAYAVVGIEIDHFHCVEVVDGQEYVTHFNKDADGTFYPDFSPVMPITGPQGYIFAVADTWHE